MIEYIDDGVLTAGILCAVAFVWRWLSSNQHVHSESLPVRFINCPDCGHTAIARDQEEDCGYCRYSHA